MYNSINVIHCLYLIIILKNKNTDDMKKLFLLLMGFISSLCIWADTTIYSMTNPTAPTEKLSANSGASLTATYVNGTGYVYNGKGSEAALVSGSQVNLGGSGNSYCEITITNGEIQEGDIIDIGVTSANSFYVSSTPTKSEQYTFPYEVTKNSLLKGATSLYFFKGTQSKFSYVTIIRPDAATSPVVKTMPLSHTYALGTPTVSPLTVEVSMVDSENDYLEYQWFSNASNSNNGGVAIPGANSASYTPDISTVGVTYYYCEIVEKNANDEVVGSAAVTNTCAIEVISEVKEPTFSEINGTVRLDCATDVATIEYSLDNGATWIAYSRPFTILDNNVKVLARATAGGGYLVSQVVSHTVEAVKASPGSSSIVLYYDANNNFSLGPNDDGEANNALIGKEGTEYEEWKVQVTGTGKTISYGSSINGNASIKGSNGRQMSIVMPVGVVANRITLYSYINSAEVSDKCYWSEVAGESFGTSSIAMASWSDANNPDIRVFGLDNVEDEITLNNAGRQLCFYAVIDYTIDAGSVILNSEGLATYSSDKAVYVSGAQAYTCVLDDDNSTIDAQPIESNEIPALSGVLLYGEPGATVTLIQISSAAALGSNDLKPTTDITTPNGVAVLENNALALSGNVFKLYTGRAFVANKAYLVLNDATAGAKGYSLRFIAQEEEKVTAVEAPEAVETAETTGVKKAVKDGRLLIETATGVFTLSGARIK